MRRVKARKSPAARLSEFFSFHGRATGAYAFGAYLILVFVSAVVAELVKLASGLAEEVTQTLVMALIVPTFVRRMHDNGRSGRWAIIPAIGLVPREGKVDLPLDAPAEILALLVAPFFLWGIYLLAQASDGDAERFGPDPRLG
jgi:uncharacterized membrane protein YhaH (DUF805 family)